jgi:hypothetical protein
VLELQGAGDRRGRRRHVYWNDFAGGKVVSCAIGGCANTPTTIAPTQPSAEGVTVDGTNLYWASSGSILTCVPPACSTRTPLVTTVAGTVVHVASETGAAYWVSSSTLASCPYWLDDIWTVPDQVVRKHK